MTFLVHRLIRTTGLPHARQIGEYWNFDEAVTAATHEIDKFLYREYKRNVWHGISADKLFLLYQRTGQSLLIVPKVSNSTVVPQFDHLKYAENKCAEICANAAPPPDAAATTA